MKRLLICLLFVFAGTLTATANGQTPAGYILTVELVGVDRAHRTAIARNGAELPPRLMMPLFDGDVVFLRDPASRIGIELGDGKAVEVGGSLSRLEIAGEVDTGDSTWSIIATIAGLIGGGEELPPDNMVSRGGTLKVPMAVRERNYLLPGRRGLWLGWDGGNAPYSITLEMEGVETPLASGLMGQETTLRLPDRMADRFSLILRASGYQKVVMRFGFDGRLPRVPEGIAAASGRGSGRLAFAAWLTSQMHGAWTVEALQTLKARPNPAAEALAARIRSGWRLE